MSPAFRPRVSGPIPKSVSKPSARRRTGRSAARVPIEVSGKRQRRIDVAQRDPGDDRGRDGAGDGRRPQPTCVAPTFRRWARCDGSQAAQELEGIATRARDAAQERFQTGAAPRLEALQAGARAVAGAERRQRPRAATLNAARAELNALLAYPADAAPALADPLEAAHCRPSAGASSRRSTGNAELKVLQTRIDEERARVALAKAMRHPDPSVTGTLTYDAQPRVHLRLARRRVRSRCRSSRPAAPEVAVAEATLDARHRRSRRASRADHRRRRRRRWRAPTARAAGGRALPERHPAGVACRWSRWRRNPISRARRARRRYLQTLQAAREIRQRALQAGLDYQLALADLERAMGTPLQMRRCDSRLPLWRWRPRFSARPRAKPTVEEVRDDRGRAGEDHSRSRRRPSRASSSPSGVVAAAPGADWVITAPEPARIVELPKAEGRPRQARRSAGPLRDSVARDRRRHPAGRSRAGAGARGERAGLGRRA